MDELGNLERINGDGRLIGRGDDESVLRRFCQFCVPSGYAINAALGKGSCCKVRSHQCGSAEVGSAEGGSSEVGSAEVGIAEKGSAQVSSAEIGSAENGSLEGGSSEVGSSEGGSSEVRSAEDGSLEGGSSEVGSVEGGSSEVGSEEDSKDEGGKAEDGSSQVCSAEEGKAEEGKAEEGSSEGGFSEVCSPEVCSVEGGKAKIGSYLWMVFSPRIPSSYALFEYRKVFLVCHLLPPVVPCYYSCPGDASARGILVLWKECEAYLQSRLLAEVGYPGAQWLLIETVVRRSEPQQ